MVAVLALGERENNYGTHEYAAACEYRACEYGADEDGTCEYGMREHRAMREYVMREYAGTCEYVGTCEYAGACEHDCEPYSQNTFNIASNTNTPRTKLNTRKRQDFQPTHQISRPLRLHRLHDVQRSDPTERGSPIGDCRRHTE